MPPFKPSIVSAFVALLAASPLTARAATVLTGEICSQRVHELTCDIKWSTNLQQAEAAAKAQGKLVFWVQMVGKIDGAT